MPVNSLLLFSCVIMTVPLFYSIVTFSQYQNQPQRKITTSSKQRLINIIPFLNPQNSFTVMNLKTSKRTMRNGFMCHSKASTAVYTCTSDPRSVVVPRTRTRRHERSVSLDDTRLINYAKYSKLVESSKFNSANKKRDSVSVPNIKHQENESRELQQKPTDNVFQVVVMRVAIHCQGCAGKVKKHLSKMEGVTSFSVDVESKRVTVMGHISPLGVLESISKVKRAEFWNC